MSRDPVYVRFRYGKLKGVRHRFGDVRDFLRIQANRKPTTDSGAAGLINIVR